MTITRKTISYELRDGVEEGQFLQASAGATEDIATLDGYIERRVYRTTGGRWLDEVIWASRAAADASDDAISQMAQCARCIGLMNHDTFEIAFAELEQSAGELLAMEK